MLSISSSIAVYPCVCRELPNSIAPRRQPIQLGPALAWHAYPIIDKLAPHLRGGATGKTSIFSEF
jgi:hypothetical protein